MRPNSRRFFQQLASAVILGSVAGHLAMQVGMPPAQAILVVGCGVFLGVFAGLRSLSSD
jgi:hypothetical protein